jgi:hypothetical protein
MARRFPYLFRDLENARDEADARATDWQRALVPGDKIAFRAAPDLVVVSEILDPATDADPEEVEEVRDLYASPHMVGYRFSRGYSAIVPNGELGDIHVSTAQVKLTERQFGEFKTLGFPSDEETVTRILSNP